MIAVSDRNGVLQVFINSIPTPWLDEYECKVAGETFLIYGCKKAHRQKRALIALHRSTNVQIFEARFFDAKR